MPSHISAVTEWSQARWRFSTPRRRKSTGVSDVSPTHAQLNGLLTLHGVEKPVTLDLEILGQVKDNQGKVRAGFTASTSINRKDFGIIWNKMLETGQIMVGEEVKITLEIEAIQK